MNDDLGQQIVDLYDGYVRQAGDEVKLADARDAILPEVVDLLTGTDRDLNSEAEQMIRTTIGDVRAKRSRSLREQLQHILGGFDEDGAYVDPLLDQAYSIGDTHGIDKTLRLWTAEDFSKLVVTRYRVAAEATKAAAEIDDISQQCIDRMLAAGVKMFGELA